jgi:hypothetical protein
MARRHGVSPPQREHAAEARKDTSREVVPSSRKRTRAQWAAELREAQRKTVEGILALGQKLINAKRDLDCHGEWLPLLQDLNIEPRYAQRLMALARNPRLRALMQMRDLSHLPRAVSTLSVLAAIPEAEFEAGIASGAISPSMTAKQAQSIPFMITTEKREPYRIPSGITKTETLSLRPPPAPGEMTSPDELRQANAMLAKHPASEATKGFQEVATMPETTDDAHPIASIVEQAVRDGIGAARAANIDPKSVPPELHDKIRRVAKQWAQVARNFGIGDFFSGVYAVQNFPWSGTTVAEQAYLLDCNHKDAPIVGYYVKRGPQDYAVLHADPKRYRVSEEAMMAVALAHETKTEAAE